MCFIVPSSPTSGHRTLKPPGLNHGEHATTTGAKSGEPRTVAVFGIPHPDGLGLIASNFGGEKHPAWYYNLKANPQATVSAGRDTWRATARLATDSERDEIWAKGLEVYPGWRKYETRAGDRHIEAFVLSRD